MTKYRKILRLAVLFVQFVFCISVQTSRTANRLHLQDKAAGAAQQSEPRMSEVCIHAPGVESLELTDPVSGLTAGRARIGNLFWSQRNSQAL